MAEGINVKLKTEKQQNILRLKNLVDVDEGFFFLNRQSSMAYQLTRSFYTVERKGPDESQAICFNPF